MLTVFLFRPAISEVFNRDSLLLVTYFYVFVYHTQCLYGVHRLNGHFTFNIYTNIKIYFFYSFYLTTHRALTYNVVSCC